MVVQEIAVAANAVGPCDHCPITRPFRTGSQALHVAARQMRRLDHVDLADGDRFAVQECAAASLRVGEFAVARRTRDAQNHLATMHQGNLRRKHRILAHEGLGAVYGIHYPKKFSVLAMQARLLAKKAVFRKTRLDDLADGRLAADIGLRDRRFVGLDANFDIALVQCAGNFRRLFCGIERRLQFWGMIHGTPP